jgi:hypothetical protein
MGLLSCLFCSGGPRPVVDEPSGRLPCLTVASACFLLIAAIQSRAVSFLMQVHHLAVSLIAVKECAKDVKGGTNAGVVGPSPASEFDLLGRGPLVLCHQEEQAALRTLLADGKQAVLDAEGRFRQPTGSAQPAGSSIPVEVGDPELVSLRDQMLRVALAQRPGESATEAQWLRTRS